MPVVFTVDDLVGDGQRRRFCVYLPRDWVDYMPQGDSAGLPVVLVLPGGSGTIRGTAMDWIWHRLLLYERVRRDTRHDLFSPLQDSRFILVQVEAYGFGGADDDVSSTNWNDGSSGNVGPYAQPDDVGYIARVLEVIRDRLWRSVLRYNPDLDEREIDIDHVISDIYLVGFSSGAHMCYRLASELGTHDPAFVPTAMGVAAGHVGGFYTAAEERAGADPVLFPPSPMHVLQCGGRRDANVPMFNDLEDPIRMAAGVDPDVRAEAAARVPPSASLVPSWEKLGLYVGTRGFEQSGVARGAIPWSFTMEESVAQVAIAAGAPDPPLVDKRDPRDPIDPGLAPDPWTFIDWDLTEHEIIDADLGLWRFDVPTHHQIKVIASANAAHVYPQAGPDSAYPFDGAPLFLQFFQDPGGFATR